MDNNSKPYVVNLCRNTESHHRDGGRPKYGLDIAYIDENSDFSYIYHGMSDTPIEKLYYMRNFIRYTPFYRNSHLSKMAMKRYYGTFGLFYKIFCRWELPYKSTLVVPLIKEEGVNRDLVGFISIDSPSNWSFSKDYDVPIIQHISKSLCPVICRFAQNNLLRS